MRLIKSEIFTDIQNEIYLLPKVFGRPASL